jgi:hypothetical protein
MLSKNPNTKVEIIENIYEMIIQSKMMYGIDVWSLEEAWEEIYKIHGMFCKK